MPCRHAWQLASLAGALLVCAISPAAQVEGVDLNVDFADASFTGGPQPITAWIRRSMEIVGAYYGEFPTRRLSIRVRSAAGHGVKTGSTFGSGGGMIRVVVGREVTGGELRDDWVLVHEMTHLALPDVGPEHAWLSEGLATYVEGIARAQAGNRTPQDVWAEQMRSMPKGLPQSGDAGLDRTHSWGRTYWGGALFCLVADIEIHRQTQNRFGLQEAMRAVARASGGLGTDWPVERIFATGDAAVGTQVLEKLYSQWKEAPVRVDLAGIWRDLGVEPDGAGVRLVDEAPLADVRRAIMRPNAEARSAGPGSF